jgi:hypothetical protein
VVKKLFPWFFRLKIIDFQEIEKNKIKNSQTHQVQRIEGYTRRIDNEREAESDTEQKSALEQHNDRRHGKVVQHVTVNFQSEG